MFDLTRDIDSLSNFKRQTSKYVQRMREGGQPLVLTVNGKPQFVVQDVVAYQHLLELIDRVEAIQGIQRGLTSLGRGEGSGLSDADTQLRKSLNIPQAG